MKLVIKSFFQGFSILKKDKIILLYSLIPIIIGLFLFGVMGSWISSEVVPIGEKWIQSKVSSANLGGVLTFILRGLFYIIFGFLVSWTFVLITSIIASPFNDAISERTEKIIKGEVPTGMKESFSRLLKSFIQIIIAEIKKVLLIIFIAILAFALSFIPVLAPFSIGLSSLLMAMSFVDYSWSRHRLNFKSCANDLRVNWFSYSALGLVFLFLVSIPIINLMVLPFGTIVFTVLFVEKSLK